MRLRNAAALLLACLALAELRPVAVAQSSQKTVLVLIATRREAPASTVLDGTIRAILHSGLAGNLDYYTEYLDTARFPEPEYQQVLKDFLRRKYADQKFDVVVATSDAMFDFVDAYRDEVSPGAAVVYLTATPRAGPNVTGVVSPFELRRTVDLARHLHPDLRHLFVVTGESADDRFYSNILRSQLRPLEEELGITYSSGLAMPELLQRVAQLPPQTAIYFLTFFEDGHGGRFIPFDAFNQVAAVANAPVYHWTELGMGFGMLGGNVSSFEQRGRAVGDLVLRVLRGEAPDSIPIQEIDANVILFDWRQLKRWNLIERQLPAGSLIRFREPSLWDQYKVEIIGAASVIALQTALIAGLLVQRARRRESEASLQTSMRQNQALAGRLITAQEDERRRIARDLHDDFNQRLALLSVEMEMLGHSDSDLELGARSGRLAAQLRELSSDLHKLSHQLHPAKVDQLGLVTAARSLCAEIAKQSGIRIECLSQNVPADLPSNVALGVYRIIQESLHNVVRHSQASAGRVELVGVSGGLRLTVSDEGQGFDAGQPTPTPGLGLVGMQERVRLLQGTMVVSSSPGQGTRIEVTVPLAATAAAAR